MALDETISPGQSGHIADHQEIAAYLNDLPGRFAEINSPHAFGAVGDGTTNDLPAIQAAVAAAISNGLPVELGPYNYRIDGSITFDPGPKGLTFRGLGLRSKLIQANPTSNFFTVGTGSQEVNNVHFSDFAVTSASQQTAGWVFHIIQAARCTWTRLVMQDPQDTNLGKRLYNGLWLDRFDDVTVTDCQFNGGHWQFTGEGLRANGASNGSFGAGLNILGGNKMSGWGNALHFAGACGGVYLNETDVIDNGCNLRLSRTQQNVVNRELFVGSQTTLDYCQYDNVYIEGGSIVHLDMSGTWIASGSQAMGNGANINVAGTMSGLAVFNFTGCRIYNSNAFGVLIGGSVRAIFSGCSIQYNGLVTSDVTTAGVTITASGADVLIGNSVVNNNGNTTSNVGHGVYWAGSASGSRLLMSNNIFSGNQLAPFNKPTLNASVQARDNIGLVTSNSGTATIPTTAAFIDVTHGLYNTPQQVFVTPVDSDPGNRYWVSSIGATTFRINLLAAPTTAKVFHWRAITGNGY